MEKDEKIKYEAFQKELDGKVDGIRKHLQKISDVSSLALIDARKKIDYELTDSSREKFADQVAEAFEGHIKNKYALDSDPNIYEMELEGKMREYFGVTRKELKRIVMSGVDAEDVYKRIEQEINQANSRLKQSHFTNAAEEYVDINKPETLDHIIKYINLESHKGIDLGLAKKQPDKLKNLFMVHGVEGQIRKEYIPKEFMKQVKPKKKKAK